MGADQTKVGASYPKPHPYLPHPHLPPPPSTPTLTLTLAPTLPVCVPDRAERGKRAEQICSGLGAHPWDIFDQRIELALVVRHFGLNESRVDRHGRPHVSVDGVARRSKDDRHDLVRELYRCEESNS